MLATTSSVLRACGVSCAVVTSPYVTLSESEGSRGGDGAEREMLRLRLSMTWGEGGGVKRAPGVTLSVSEGSRGGSGGGSEMLRCVSPATPLLA